VAISLFGIFITGGFPGSVVVPVLIALPVVVFLLYGSKAGTGTAMVIPLLMVVQWVLVETGLLSLPDITSLTSQVANKIVVVVITYGTVVSVVASYQYQNALLRSELNSERASLARQANRDGLTDLYNSHHFYSELERCDLLSFEEKAGLAVLFLDLDNFKQINDSFGHPVGDGVLQQVANRLRECVRFNETIARMGGDEFAILVKGVDNRRAIDELCNRLRHAINRPIVLDGVEYQIGTSIGSASFLETSDNVQDLLQSADHAMYRDKLKKTSRRMAGLEKPLPRDSVETDVAAA
jgi:diguanylate cyclase (GGDEF)-like protein